jgi:Capsule assembly protein Wzi/PAP2 superfamily
MATIGTRENESEGEKSRTAQMSGYRLIAVLFCMSYATNVWAQREQTHDTKASDSAQTGKKDDSAEKKDNLQPASLAPGPLLKNLVQDQKDIWTSPFRMRGIDLKWAVPFAGITTRLIMTDRIVSHEASCGTHVNASKILSDAGLAFVGDSSAGFCSLGRACGDKQTETAARSDKSSIQTDVPPEGNSAGGQSKRSGTGLLRRFVNDQQAIWSSPAGLRFSDTEWLVPLSGITAGLFVTDSEFSRHLSKDPNTISRYKNISNAGVGALVGGAAGMWLLGHASHNEHWSETGFLAGEAALNSLVIVEGLKYSLRRQRPFQGDGTGPFFQSGGTSFPSEHAAAAWSVAGVIAHEYPGPLTKIMAYGLASLVSASRVKSRQHFPSDVLIGNVMGNLIAQSIYSRHYNPDLGGGEWKSISQFFRDGNSSPANQGSPYVPLDSWIYPALDRLAGLGLIDGGFAGMRPWTRRECTRLITEAEGKLSGDEDEDENKEAVKLVASLKREFRFELETADGGDNTQLRLESAYMRTEYISGTPLNDGYHFGQTQINDFGRPYGGGWNTITGFSTYSTSGRWSAYVRGEWQTAPALPAFPLTARQTIQNVDFLPQLPPNTDTPSVNQFRLLDAYVGLTASNWEFSFGKQSLLWGPGEGGPMMYSDNAVPINMFRVNRVAPVKLPSILGWLGPIRMETFLGQLDGSEFLVSPSGFVGQFGQSLSPQPFLNGQKLSFKPTRNLEFGISRTTVYGGPGYPLTLHTFFRSVVSRENKGTFGTSRKPGDRRSGVDFSYRLPRLRNWVSFYADGYTDDEISPIGYADRSAWRAGLYFSHFPRIQKLDLRVEGVYTDNPLGGALGHGFYYFNFTWRTGYRNDRNLIGSWIGREGQGAQAWTNYWFTPRNRLQFNFRHQKVSQEFIPGGGTLTDVGTRGDYWVRSDLSLSASVQYERWLFPVIQPNAQKIVSATVGIQFQPPKLLRRAAGGSIGAESGTGGRP